MSKDYGYRVRMSLGVTAATTVVTAALKQEGFGVPTQIDVQATMQAKLGVATRPYLILGACNPQLAYQALQTEPELGLLLPCNVIVYDNGDETTTVSIVDPIQMLGVVENPALQPVAEEANRRLQRVVAHLAAQPTLQA
jgi:uncharacterized protein (DUF302 family)